MCFDIKHISNILNQASDSILMCCWLDLTVKRSLQSAQKYKKNDIKCYAVYKSDFKKINRKRNLKKI